MSATTSETSITTTNASEFSSDSTCTENELHKEISVKQPGPVENQIEEFLKNWDPKGRFMQKKLKNQQNEEKEASDHEQNTLAEDMMTSYLSVEEPTTYKSCYSPLPINAQIWQQINGHQPYDVTKITYKPGIKYGPLQFETPINNRIPSEPNMVLSNLQTPKLQQPSNINLNAAMMSPDVYFAKNSYLENPYRTTVSQHGDSNSHVQEVKNLEEQEAKISSLTEKLANMTEENETLKAQIEKQQSSLQDLGPRYKYLEENFEEFIKMKEEYLKLKKGVGKEVVFKETQNKFVQTWATTVMCANCVKTFEMLRNPKIMNLIRLQGNEAFCVSRSELSELEAKFRALKENISERERDYENREEKAELIHLTALNVGYRSRTIELEAKNRQAMHWANALQRIIAKIYSSENTNTLTTQEQKWVERILHKYADVNETSENSAKTLQEETIEKSLDSEEAN